MVSMRVNHKVTCIPACIPEVASLTVMKVTHAMKFANLKVVISKLPYQLEESFRRIACDM